MGCYQIKWKTSAKKDFKKLDKTVIPKILKAVDSLVENPRPSGVKKIIDSYSTYRLRVGNYRVIYTICDEVLIIEVIKIGHRQSIYND